MRWVVLLACTAMAGRGQDLGAALAAASPAGVAYVGYDVPMQAGQGTVCNNWNGGIETRQKKLMLDGPSRLRMLFRVDNGKVDKLLLASEDCEIDSGTQRVVMLPGVTSASSIRYLALRSDDSGLYAISLHRDPLATETLIALVRDSKNPRQQKKALFWLALSKDAKAEQFIERILH